MQASFGVQITNSLFKALANGMATQFPNGICKQVWLLLLCARNLQSECERCGGSAWLKEPSKSSSAFMHAQWSLDRIALPKIDYTHVIVTAMGQWLSGDWIHWNTKEFLDFKFLFRGASEVWKQYRNAVLRVRWGWGGGGGDNMHGQRVESTTK